MNNKFNKVTWSEKVKSKVNQEGVALLEALIALLIFSMGVIALVGMQAAMISNTSASKYRADASFLVQQRLGEVWADPTNLNAFIETAASPTDISALIPSGTRTTTILLTPAVSPTLPSPSGQVRVTVTWQVPGDSDIHTESAEARVVVNP